MDEKKILFDDTQVSGWCVMRGESDEVVMEDAAGFVYGVHATCARFKTLFPTSVMESDGSMTQRWSWFSDDTTPNNGIAVCFECEEYVPEHIQALVVLHHHDCQLPTIHL